MMLRDHAGLSSGDGLSDFPNSRSLATGGSLPGIKLPFWVSLSQFVKWRSLRILSRVESAVERDSDTVPALNTVAPIAHNYGFPWGRQQVLA